VGGRSDSRLLDQRIRGTLAPKTGGYVGRPQRAGWEQACLSPSPPGHPAGRAAPVLDLYACCSQGPLLAPQKWWPGVDQVRPNWWGRCSPRLATPSNPWWEESAAYGDQAVRSAAAGPFKPSAGPSGLLAGGLLPSDSAAPRRCPATPSELVNGRGQHIDGSTSEFSRPMRPAGALTCCFQPGRHCHHCHARTGPERASQPPLRRAGQVPSRKPICPRPSGLLPLDRRRSARVGSHEISGQRMALP